MSAPEGSATLYTRYSLLLVSDKCSTGFLQPSALNPWLITRKSTVEPLIGQFLFLFNTIPIARYRNSYSKNILSPPRRTLRRLSATTTLLALFTLLKHFFLLHKIYSRNYYPQQPSALNTWLIKRKSTVGPLIGSSFCIYLLLPPLPATAILIQQIFFYSL